MQTLCRRFIYSVVNMSADKTIVTFANTVFTCYETTTVLRKYNVLAYHHTECYFSACVNN